MIYIKLRKFLCKINKGYSCENFGLTKNQMKPNPLFQIELIY